MRGLLRLVEVCRFFQDDVGPCCFVPHDITPVVTWRPLLWIVSPKQKGSVKDLAQCDSWGVIGTKTRKKAEKGETS